MPATQRLLTRGVNRFARKSVSTASALHRMTASVNPATVDPNVQSIALMDDGDQIVRRNASVRTIPHVIPSLGNVSAKGAG